MNSNKIKSELFNFFQYIFVISLILECRSVWTRLIPIENWFNILLYICIFFSTIMCFCMTKTSRKKVRNLFGRILIISALGGIYFFFTPMGKIGFLKFFLAVMICLIHYSLCTKDYGKELLKKYSDIIYIIAIISLICWLLVSVFNVFHANKIVYYSWSGTGEPVAIRSFYGIYYETQFIRELSLIRNTSIFTEASMCSFHFSISLLIFLFVMPKTSKRKAIIITLAIFSTISSTGIILAISAWFLKFMLDTKVKEKSFGHLFKFLILPVLVCISAIFILNMLESKMETYSGEVRLSHLQGSFKAWLSSPFFGVGFGNSQAILYYSGQVGNSNSIMQLLAYGGIIFVLPYIFSVFSGIINALKTKNYGIICFIILFLVMFSFTFVTYQYLCVIMFIIFSTSYKINTGS